MVATASAVFKKPELTTKELHAIGRHTFSGPSSAGWRVPEQGDQHEVAQHNSYTRGSEPFD